MPPFGHSTQLRVFVDPDLLQYDEVWAAAGTWNDNFGAAPADIVRVAGGVVTDLKRARIRIHHTPVACNVSTDQLPVFHSQLRSISCVRSVLVAER